MLTIAVVWFVVVGCASYEDRPLSAEKTLDEFESCTLNRADLGDYLRKNLQIKQWPLKAWGLSELTLAAFFYNPKLDVARAQWSVAGGEEKTAAERPNPELSLAPGFNSTTGYGTGISPWLLSAVIDIPIETAGKRRYRMAEARYLGEAARLQIAQTAWEIRREVREALLDLYSAAQTELLLEARQKLLEDNAKLLERLFELGEISANELSQARVLRDQTRLTALNANKRQEEARARLAGAIGMPVSALASVELSFETLEALPGDAPPDEYRRRALVSREDLLAALAEYQASQFALQQEIARQYPDIRLGPGYELDQGEKKWVLGLSVTLPAFNRNKGAIAAAEARREAAAAKFRTVQAWIINDIELAAANYRACRKKMETAEALAQELGATADRVRKMREIGDAFTLDVTASELELNANAESRLEARIETLRALGEMEDAMHAASDLPKWSKPLLNKSSEPAWSAKP
jgi:cobalt-zinc-cadmium efflux system outer membrane protein